MKNNGIELPLLEPLYSTYHHQGIATAILAGNPSILNWYLSQIMILTCTRRFLTGYTSPEVSIADSTFGENPYLDKKWYPMQFLGGHINTVIRRLLDAGYYVYFSGIDDYYIEGKSWYHERHFSHDGCICGYNRADKTYSVYAYDQNWIYRRFSVTQKSFDAGRRAMCREGKYGFIGGFRPKDEQIAFSHATALQKIEEYLDSTMEKYPPTSQGVVYGIVVHDYLAKYIGKLYDGSVPYERMDRRVFRLIWDHKKVMLTRIRLIEEALSLDDGVSCAYRSVVREADNCRMLYAAHHLRRRDALLPLIRDKLLALKAREEALLKELLQKAKGEEAS